TCRRSTSGARRSASRRGSDMNPNDVLTQSAGARRVKSLLCGLSGLCVILAACGHRPAPDANAAVARADALLRQTRVTGNAGLAVDAEKAIDAVLANDPSNYDARRMLATVYASQHRFRDAIAEATRCRDLRPYDAWNYGVLGDAHLELGDYDEAFAAFDRM